MKDSLGYDVTPERVQELLDHIGFKSDATSRETSLIVAALQQRVERLETELRFYADESTYQRPLTEYGWGRDVPIDRDRGKRARAALADAGPGVPAAGEGRDA